MGMPTRHTVSCELSWKRCTTRRSPRPPVSNTEDLSPLTVSTNSCPCPKLTDAWSEEPPSMPRSSDASSTSNKNNNDDDDAQRPKQLSNPSDNLSGAIFCSVA